MREIVMKLFSTNLQKYKTLHIYLPTKYSIKNTYPVLYMHDGQNLAHKSPYSQASWQVVKTLKSQKRDLIVVGIDSDKDREKEYCPFIPFYARKNAKSRADKYAKFIVEELKPLIDAQFSTKKEFLSSYMAGSSYGACISVYISLMYPSVFSKIGVFSLASFPFQDNFEQLIKSVSFNPKAFYYVTVGTNECNKDLSKIHGNYYLMASRTFVKELELNKIPHYYQEFDGDYHSEKCWRGQFVNFAKLL